MTEKHELECLPFFFSKGLIVLSILFFMVFGLNHMMQRFLDAEIAAVQAIAEHVAKVQAELAATRNKEQEVLLKAKLAVKKAEQYEEFYQKYKARHSYHYYGQFYEMYDNMYNADTIIIGTSHATHGINPLYLEEVMPEKSWFNFALNGTNPTYYLDWWKIFLESGYPIPDTIIYCVDWFMCDNEWLWRRIDFDTNPDCPVDIMRKIKATENSPIVTEEDSVEIDSNMTGPENPVKYTTLEELVSYAFSRIPIIYSRDRIPQMVQFYLSGRTIQMSNPDSDISPSKELVTTGEPLPEIPIFEHEYLIDQNYFVTSSYYKGYIPWECNYTGEPVVKTCRDQETEWNAFVELLDIFQEKNIHIIFVEVPEFLQGRSEDKMKNNNRRIQEIANERSISFYNYNEELLSDINGDFTNFSDWGHLNTTGSTAFSRLLAQDLKNYFEDLN